MARIWIAICLALLAIFVASCLAPQMGQGERHRWWAGLGPVLPHDSFPDKCEKCHVGSSWNQLRDDFEFDHAKETGYALQGAHQAAQCLRCHNDRGPVQVFAQKGCAGCHDDVHQGDLGRSCDECHTQSSWQPFGQIERHARTRFPLTGSHAAVSCHSCHPGIRSGNLLPADPECVSCHQDDLQNTQNPPHIPLGWINNCDRCHAPTRWEFARIR